MLDSHKVCDETPVQIAIIVPAYNVAPWLLACLQSVLCQTHGDWSLTLVDDGSTDATFKIAASTGDPRIRIVRQANAGVSAARNRGLREALSGTAGAAPEAVLLLDADDWLDPTALEHMSATLADAPWAVAAVGGFARCSSSGVTGTARPPPEGNLLERLLMRNLFVNGGHLLLRPEAIEQAGWFREDLCYGEDWEYWTRIALLGEFVATRSRTPVLYLRERYGSAYHRMAIDPGQSGRVLDAIYANPAFAQRLGARFVRALRARAEAEAAWAIGRELVRHGRSRDGRRWLARGFLGAPGAKRLALMGLSWMHAGPFRPYAATGQGA